ncbi:MAG: Ppx/GppA family phosphatase [Phycisphaeraceae bacterium]|nr:Ppx/GppA family phosphatase [Phycisphaeraceae bacterium]
MALAEMPKSRKPVQGARTLFAAIDIGSNAVRFALASADARGELKILDERRRPTRLGANLSNGKGLPKPAMKATIAAVKEFCFDAIRHGVRSIRMVATAAVRESPDGAGFVERLEHEVGLPVEIIGADEESRLAFASCRAAFELERQTVAIVDIGGGSVQVSLARKGVLFEAVSMPLGAVRLTSAFKTPGGKESQSALQRMRKHVARMIEEALPPLVQSPTAVIGCGGTFAAIGALLGDFAGNRALAPMLAQRRRSLVRAGHASEELVQLVGAIERMDIPQRASLLRRVGVPPDRADILPAGVIVARALVKHLGADRIVPHPGGVRDGMLREMSARATACGMVERARAIAREAHYEVAHSEQVAHLAVSLLHDLADVDRIREALDDRPDATELLESAGLLHDTGVPIDYDRHHKVSRRIIELANWGRISPVDRAVIANIARYHRKSLPAEKHAPFWSLPARERQVVRVLAGILRIADGLDRSHRQITTGVRVRVTPASLQIIAEGARADGPDIRAASKKSDLLCASIRRKISVVAG